MNPKFKQLFSRYGFVLVMFALIVMIITGVNLPFEEALTEYLVHIMLLFLIMGLFFLILNKDKYMLGSMALCAILCVFLKNESSSAMHRPEANGSPTISVAHINLSSFNNNYDLIDLLSTQSFDIISFQEFTPDWVGLVNRLLKHSHPNKVEMVRIDPFGKGIYSKYEIDNIDSILHSKNIDLEFDITVEDQLFHIVSSYITPALDDRSKELAKDQLINLAKCINDKNAHTIVLGEYNMVYWSREIIEFRNNTNLKNSRREIMPASLKVPYDHIFYSDNLSCLELKDLVLEEGSRVGVTSKFQYASNLDLQTLRSRKSALQ